MVVEESGWVRWKELMVWFLWASYGIVVLCRVDSRCNDELAANRVVAPSQWAIIVRWQAASAIYITNECEAFLKGDSLHVLERNLLGNGSGSEKLIGDGMSGFCVGRSCLQCWTLVLKQLAITFYHPFGRSYILISICSIFSVEYFITEDERQKMDVRRDIDLWPSKNSKI